jgi:predicted ThiF/HesA family dinucleotide-utilizing enzyme
MKTVVIVGVGALGSQLCPLLRNANAALTVVDFDHVEAKNVRAQFHPKGTVGKNKVVGLAQTVDFLYGQKLRTNSNKLVSENASQLLGAPDLIIDCLDNGAGRRVIQDHVRKGSIPCLHGAVDADGTFGRVVWDEGFRVDDEDGAGAPTCEDGEHLPFLAIVSAHLAHAAKEFLAKGVRIGYQVSPGGTIRT